MIPLPENQSIIQVVTKEGPPPLQGSVFRTQTGMKFVGEGKDRKKVQERLVSIRDPEGIEHTLDLDSDVESLKVIKERKDVQADLAAAESEKSVAAEDGEVSGEVVPPEGGDAGA